MGDVSLPTVNLLKGLTCGDAPLITRGDGKFRNPSNSAQTAVWVLEMFKMLQLIPQMHISII